MKTIRLINANLGKVATVETEATTWGELQTEEDVKPFLSGNTVAVIRENQNSLDVDTAQLPDKLTDEDVEHDFTLFFVTKKSKAGAEDYESWSFAQLRAEAASRDSIEPNTPGNYGGRDEIIASLRADDQANASGSDSACDPSFQELVLAGLERIEQKVDALSSGDTVAPSEQEEGDGITEQERRELEAIGNQL